MFFFHRIEANPKKIHATEQLQPPSTVKEVQVLTGWMVALSRFISPLGERGLPFFKVIHKSNKKFQWSEEADKAFEGIKAYLSNHPVLVSPLEGEHLLVYLAATPNVFSALLVAEREGSQRPIYYISKVLHRPKERYSEVQKLIYALLMTSRKLRHYFQSYKITLPSSFPLRNILHNQEVTGRIAKWAVEIKEFDFHFTTQTVMKSHVLADFVAEWTNTKNQPQVSPVPDDHWKLYFDGSHGLKGSGQDFADNTTR